MLLWVLLVKGIDKSGARRVNVVNKITLSVR